MENGQKNENEQNKERLNEWEKIEKHITAKAKANAKAEEEILNP